MRKKMCLVTCILLITSLVFSTTAVSAMLIPAAEVAKEKSRADNSPVIEEVNNHLVLAPFGLERIVLILYKKGDARTSGAVRPGTKCYAFLGKGVKWKTTASYVIDPDNPNGLTQEFIANAIFNGAEEWDAYTSKDLFNNIYTIDYSSSWDTSAPDGRNELLFGNYIKEGVIAVTVIWGYFSGAPSTKRIVEFDVLFDTDFTWGDATLDPTVMDLQNIATHEIGHGAGMADLYDSVCMEETMYGYSTNGETKKKTLNNGDIAGIRTLYGI